MSCQRNTSVVCMYSRVFNSALLTPLHDFGCCGIVTCLRPCLEGPWKPLALQKFECRAADSISIRRHCSLILITERDQLNQFYHFSVNHNFVTGDNDSDTSVHHFETVCFSLGRQYFIHGASINFHSQHQGFRVLQPYHPQRAVNIPAWLQLFRRETPSRSHLCMFRVRPYLVRPLKAVCHS